jgi:hypothetical protein
MNKLRLFKFLPNGKEELVHETTVTWKEWPEVIIWNDRVFCDYGSEIDSGAYTETTYEKL